MVARTHLNVTSIRTLPVLFLTGVVLHGKLRHSNDHNPFTFGWRRKLHTSRVSLTNLLLNLYTHSTVRTCVLAVKLLTNLFLPQYCFGRFLGRTLVHTFTSFKPTLKISRFYSLAPKFTIECCFALGTARVQTMAQRAAILTKDSRYFLSPSQANIRVATQIIPQPLPTRLFQFVISNRPITWCYTVPADDNIVK